MKSVMTHSFSEVPRADIPRSSFDRSHGHKTAFDADKLVPIFLDEVVPGDTFNCNTNFFARLATPLYPIMDNMYLETFAFFVPNRLLWDNWEKFCGAQTDPGDSIDFTIPVISSTLISEGSLGDYFGLPLSTIDDVSHLPFRAYNLIWNEWFRDQNLQDSLLVETGNGPNGLGSYVLKNRGKRHDYFTSCLTAPQKGDSVSMPIGSSAPIFTDQIDNAGIEIGEATSVGGSPSQLTYMDTAGAAGNPVRNQSGTQSGTYPDDVHLYADLANATAATVNQLRLAVQTQRLLERDARSGTRYNETILAHFGVTVPDFRVQRPEYLGGGSTPINLTPVAQTTYEATPASGNAKGALAAFGTVAGNHGWTKSFTEHGIVMILANLRADITYSQGINRYWHKSTRYDFYYPVLATIGEQAVLNQEIYYQNSPGTGAAQDQGVFGYQERYAEMRYKPSLITSTFRSAAASPLDAWHLSEEFVAQPTLGDIFIQSNTRTPLDRAIAVNTEPHLIADFYFDLKCARPMPLFGVPGNLDRF